MMAYSLLKGPNIQYKPELHSFKGGQFQLIVANVDEAALGIKYLSTPTIGLPTGET